MKFSKRLDIKKPDFQLINEGIAKMYVYGFREGFRNGGGMTDASSAGWKPSYKTFKNPSLKTLIETGLLSRSIKIKSVNKKKAVIHASGRASEYAWVHNYGKMQIKREFIGDSKRIEMRVVRKLKTEIKKQILNGR